MTSIGHNNWLQISLEKGSDTNITVPFHIAYRALIKPVPFHEAADYTAKLIATKYSNLHLSLSGGLDSEYVAATLLRNNIEFTPVIFSTRYNQEENWYAYKFCADNNITPMVLDYTSFESFEMLLKKLVEHTIELNVPFDQSTLPIIIADQCSGPLITGYGDAIRYSTSYNDPIGPILELEGHDFYLELKYGDAHPGAFFSYTPELFRALITGLNTNVSTQVAKAELYGLLPRPKINFIYTSACKSDSLNKIINTVRDKFFKPAEQCFALIDSTKI